MFCDNTLWGLVNFRGDIFHHFMEKGYDVVLAAPEKEDKQMQITIPQGVTYYPIKMGRTGTNPLGDIIYFIRLFRIIKKERPTFLFTYTIKPNIYGSLAAHILGITTTAMMPGLGYAFKSKSISMIIARSLYRWGLSMTNHLLLLNEENYHDVVTQKLCNKTKIILLRGGEGVNLGHFEYTDNTAEHTTFLFVGRILWDKGYLEFVEAAKIVKQLYTDTQFKLLGSLDPFYPKSVPLERIKQDEKTGLIHYVGFTNNMKSVFREPGIVITLPSFYGEGMNRSLMEACACGKPIITTNISGCKELVDNNKNGYIVSPKNIQQLADAMIRYLKLSQQDKQTFSLNSRRKAEDIFDIKKVFHVYDQITQVIE